MNQGRNRRVADDAKSGRKKVVVIVKIVRCLMQFVIICILIRVFVFVSFCILLTNIVIYLLLFFCQICH